MPTNKGKDREALFNELKSILIADAPKGSLDSSRFMHRFQYAMLVLLYGIGQISEHYKQLMIRQVQPAPISKEEIKQILFPYMCSFLNTLILFNEYLHCDVDILSTFEEIDQGTDVLSVTDPKNGEVCIPSNIFAISRAIGVLTATSELGFDRNFGTLYHDVVYEFCLFLASLYSAYQINLDEVLESCVWWARYGTVEVTTTNNNTTTITTEED